MKHFKSYWENTRFMNEKQTSSQRKCKEHLSNLPSHRDNATHQLISISQVCYEKECMEWYDTDFLEFESFEFIDHIP